MTDDGQCSDGNSIEAEAASSWPCSVDLAFCTLYTRSIARLAQKLGRCLSHRIGEKRSMRTALRYAVGYILDVLYAMSRRLLCTGVLSV